MLTADVSSEREADPVRLVNGKWQCVICGAELEVPEGATPRPMIIGQSGQKNMRALLVDGKEIHRCPLAAPEETPALN